MSDDFKILWYFQDSTRQAMSVLSRIVIVVEVKCLSKGDIYQGERNSCRGMEEGSLLHLV